VPDPVFVTGAGRGLGAALARAYVRRGSVVACFGRRREPLDALARELGDERCIAYPGDVRDAGSVAGAAADFIARFGPPGVVVANAGISRGTLTELPEDEAAFRAILETNVLGLVNTFRPFVPAMKTARRGTLAGIASVAGFRGLPGSSAYSASKAGAIAYLEALRVELAATGIRVVTVCPGYIDTPMTARNPYAMPFLLPAEVAARRIVRAIDAGRRFAVVPWQMAIVGALLRALPRPLFDRAFARAPRKPRDAAT
jgi:NAD(P)-dependent dehydrogenase (short-subunit alcohol dehydrogenase family)